MNRDDLRAAGYMDLLAYADLHPFGYNVRVWFRCADGALAYEYIPRVTAKKAARAGFTTRVVTTWEQQAALHRELGLCVVPPGEVWVDCPLFAGMEV